MGNAQAFRKGVLLALLLAPAGGCAVFEGSTSSEPIDTSTAHWFEYNSDRRAGFLIPKTQKGVYVLSEPSPDTASAATLKVAAKAAEKGEVDVEFAKQVVQLGKRTQAVMLLREAMYRLSEMNQNAALSSDQMIALYSQVVAAAKDIAISEIEQAKADTEDAKARQAEFEAMRAQADLDAARLREDQE